jgi:hypothetical protein
MDIHINQLKRQLNIEQDYNDDDAILQHFLDVAYSSSCEYLKYDAKTSMSGFTGNTLPTGFVQAVIMLAAHFYLNRNMVSFAQGTEVPYSYRFLLDPYRDFIVG